MLSSTANYLYWMARYMERTENAARLLGGIYRMTLLPTRSGNTRIAYWEGLFQNDIERDAFLERYEGFTPDAVMTYTILDMDNPSSIRSCIWAARENVRATRHVLTTELWESINWTWLRVQKADLASVHAEGIDEFLDTIKRRAHLFRGIVYGTMRRGEAFSFWELGTHTERAENTSRLMMARAQSFHSAHRRENAVDYYQWGTLLRSVNAYKTYQEIYSGRVDPRCVADLLILNPDMPRSLRACADEIAGILATLKPGSPSATRADGILRQLKQERVDRIFRTGIGVFLDEFRKSVHEVSDHVQTDFMMVR